MSDIIVKGESEPIDDRISAMLEQSFNPKREAEPEQEPEKEVEQEAEPEEQEPDDSEPQDEEDNEEEPSNKKPTRAEKRIRQLNDQKKEAEERARALELQLAEMRPYLDLLKAQVQQPQASDKGKDAPIIPQDYETQEDFARAILQRAKEELRSEIEKEVQPLQHTLKNQQYLSQIDSWFKSHPEAAEVKDAMDKLSVNIDKDTRSLYEQQIINGNTFILDALYAMAKPVKQDNSGILKTAIKQDQERASIGSSTKSSKSNKVVNSDSAYQKALKTGDVEDYFRDKFLAMERKL
jgi:hypothetical protein